MAEAPGYWKAEHALAMRQVASLEARVKRLEEALDTCTKQLGLNIDEADWPDAYDRHALSIAVAALKDIPDAISGANDGMPRSAVCVPSAPDGRAADESPSLRHALEQAEAFLERLIAMVSGGADMTDADLAKNMNAVLDLAHEALGDN